YGEEESVSHARRFAPRMPRGGAIQPHETPGQSRRSRPGPRLGAHRTRLRGRARGNAQGRESSYSELHSYSPALGFLPPMSVRFTLRALPFLVAACGMDFSSERHVAPSPTPDVATATPPVAAGDATDQQGGQCPSSSTLYTGKNGAGTSCATAGDC